MTCLSLMSFFFFFNDTATTEIYTLSLHDALPISAHQSSQRETDPVTSWKSASGTPFATKRGAQWEIAASTRESFSVLLWMTADRKSTRLNSSHLVMSYAVFCLKKKKYILIKYRTT